MDYRRAEILSGGAGKGFCYTGYIKAKEDLGITDSDLGEKSLKFAASIGSYYAAGLSLGVKAGEIERFTENNKKLMGNLFKPRLDRIMSALAGLGNLGNPRSIENCNGDDPDSLPDTGLCDIRNLERIARVFTGDKKLKDVKDLNIIVTDRQTFKPIVMNYKTFPDVYVYEAIMASSAFLPAFSPVIIKNEGLKTIVMDGGLSNNVPLDLALLEESVREIVCVDLSYASAVRKIPVTGNFIWDYSLESFSAGAQKTRGIFEAQKLDYDKIAKDRIVEMECNGKKQVLYLTPNIHYTRSFRSDTDNVRELSEKGYEEFREALKEFEEYKKGNKPAFGTYSCSDSDSKVSI